MNHQTEPAMKLAQAAMYGGAGTTLVAGLTPGQWQAIGVISGIVVGVIGLAVTWYYKAQHLKLARDSYIKAGLSD